MDTKNSKHELAVLKTHADIELNKLRQLIDKLDRLDRDEPPMRVTVEGDKVTVAKGNDTITTSKGKANE